MIKKTIFENICEGSTEVLVYKSKEKDKGPGSKQGIPFYNPSMQLNRDLSVLLCQFLVDSYDRKPVLLDGLAASGIRGLRFANEITGDFELEINDWDEKSYNLINKNIEKYNFESVKTHNKNLNVLLSEQSFDYIDVDPFGSPAGFIDSAIRSIRNNGVIAFTATDTATLCGVYPKVCFRRYGAMPFHSVVMKEVGLRILLGFICRTAGIYDKGIQPLVSYVTDHYFRVYVKFFSSVSKANKSMDNFKIVKSGENVGFEKTNVDIGPFWLGKIQDKKTLVNVRTNLFEKKISTKSNLLKLLDLLEEESDAPAFFYTTDSLSSFLKKACPKNVVYFEKLRKNGYNVSRTHISSTGFKTDAPIKVIKENF